MRAEYLASRSITTRHGFFTRRGGVSTGPYASLNCSLSGGDDPAQVTRNRALAAETLGANRGPVGWADPDTWRGGCDGGRSLEAGRRREGGCDGDRGAGHRTRYHHRRLRAGAAARRRPRHRRRGSCRLARRRRRGAGGGGRGDGGARRHASGHRSGDRAMHRAGELRGGAGTGGRDAGWRGVPGYRGAAPGTGSSTWRAIAGPGSARPGSSPRRWGWIPSPMLNASSAIDGARLAAAARSDIRSRSSWHEGGLHQARRRAGSWRQSRASRAVATCRSLSPGGPGSTPCASPSRRRRASSYRRRPLLSCRRRTRPPGHAR